MDYIRKQYKEKYDHENRVKSYMVINDLWVSELGSDAMNNLNTYNQSWIFVNPLLRSQFFHSFPASQSQGAQLIESREQRVDSLLTMHLTVRITFVSLILIISEARCSLRIHFILSFFDTDRCKENVWKSYRYPGQTPTIVNAHTRGYRAIGYRPNYLNSQTSRGYRVPRMVVTNSCCAAVGTPVSIVISMHMHMYLSLSIRDD